MTDLQDHIDQIVADWPPLSDEQRYELRLLLQGPDFSGTPRSLDEPKPR